VCRLLCCFFFSSRRRHTRLVSDWSSDVCSSDLEIDGVAADSTTETYAALRLDIENWRWAGVPFFIRTGKRLTATETELRLVFKEPPRLGFGLRDASSQPDQLVIRLDPSTGSRFEL